MQACQKNLKTIIISDKLNCETLLLFLISEFSQLAPSKLISGQIHDSEWPGLVRAFGAVSDWPGNIRTLSSDKKLEATEFFNLCKKSDYEVIILDLHDNYLEATEASFEIARKNKKIIVFGNHEIT